MITTLSESTADTCGGKAAALARLLHAGLPVPDGVVVPFADTASFGDAGEPATLRDELARHLAHLGDPVVAVRSSADDEDTAHGSAAGQYDSVLGVRGARDVALAVRTCWTSLTSARATAYRDAPGRTGSRTAPRMAVLVQRLVDADTAGVLFTPAGPLDSTRIEAAAGLGLGVVGGTIVPDTYEVTPDDEVLRRIARQATRVDRDPDGPGVVTRAVPGPDQGRAVLDDATARALAALGRRVATVLGGPQDVEWAVADGNLWVLQARPVTVRLPRLPARSAGHETGPGPETLVGTPGARGTAGGTARVLRGPADFPRLRPGDVAVCTFTDPSWTPLFRVAGAVVTETGGTLSHAAIVAREYGIPAVLAVPEATTRIPDDAPVVVDGAAGTVTLVPG